MEFRTYLENIENQYAYFIEKFKIACEHKNATLKTVGKVKQYELYQAILNPNAKKTIAFVGAVHGNEIVGPHSIIKFLEESKIPEKTRIILLPIINLIGFDNYTRSATDRLNINRQFDKKEVSNEAKLIKEMVLKENIDTFCTFHEDSAENAGFYIYCSPDATEMGKTATKAIKGLIPIDERKTIYGDKNQKGVITIKIENDLPQNRKSLDTWVNKVGIKALCAEFPSRFSLSIRSDAGRILMETIL